MNLRVAFRSLAKNPFTTLVAIFSLALGIGANAAIFTLFHQVLLRDLPVGEPERLVNISSPGPKEGATSCGDIAGCDAVFSYPLFRDLERQQRAFTGIAAHVFFPANLSYEGNTQSGRGLIVSGSYFPVLGLQPALGRLFSPADDATVGQPHAVVLSHSYWRTRLNQDPLVLNQKLVVNGQPLTIVGVAPEGFDGTTVGARPQIFLPITMMATARPGFNGFGDRQNHWAYLFARLKPEMSIEQARAAINAPFRSILNEVEAPLAHMSPQTLAQFKARILRLEAGNRGQSQLHAEAKTPTILLLVVTVLVLLIACANIANLLLARAAARIAEMAVRLSIGASRRHLIVQLLTESSLLASFGGVAGLVVAYWTLHLIKSLIPVEVALLDTGMGGAMLPYTAAITIGTGFLFGLFPALQTTRFDLVSRLKSQSGQTSGARTASRFRIGLATSQIALSMALLVLAGLFVKSLFNVSRIDLGLNADHVVTFRVSPKLNGYTVGRSLALYEQIENELSAQPGVTGVTTSTVPLLSGSNWGTNVSVQGFQGGPDVDQNSSYALVGPGYFQTLTVPMISGREFTRADAAGRPKVAIVNEQFARKFNLGRNAVGKRMNTGSGGELEIEIVGLAKNAKYSEVKDEIPPVVFLPYRQQPDFSSINFYVRTGLDPKQLLASLTAVVSRIDPNLPVSNAQTLPQQVQENLTSDRVLSVLSAAFAALATLLAGVGLYGVLAYTVAQRTREIGVRMALGAAPNRVRSMVFRQIAWMTGIGAAAGLFGAIAIGRFAESLLFQLNGRDPLVLSGAALLLIVVALGAGFIPAHRASRVDPMNALRYE